MDKVAASIMDTSPTGLTSYKCARLNSMPRGLRPRGLLMTKSATSAPTQAIATLPYKPSTISKA